MGGVSDRDLGAAGAVALGAHADVVVTGRNILEAIGAIVAGAHFAAQLVDDDERAGHRLLVF